MATDKTIEQQIQELQDNLAKLVAKQSEEKLQKEAVRKAHAMAEAAKLGLKPSECPDLAPEDLEVEIAAFVARYNVKASVCSDFKVTAATVGRPQSKDKPAKEEKVSFIEGCYTDPASKESWIYFVGKKGPRPEFLTAIREGLSDSEFFAKFRIDLTPEQKAEVAKKIEEQEKRKAEKAASKA